MQYTIPEKDFSELIVKRGELGGFVVKAVSSERVLEAGFGKMADAVQYINVVFGLPAPVKATGTPLPSVTPSVEVGAEGQPAPKKRGPKPGSKRTPKVSPTAVATV